MLHLDQGGKNQLYTWYFGGLLKESPNLDFDVFGLSYYPMWHGTMEGLQYNLNYLATTYNKEVCVVETAYAWTTEDGDGEGNVFISGDEEVGVVLYSFRKVCLTFYAKYTILFLQSKLCKKIVSAHL